MTKKSVKYALVQHSGRDVDKVSQAVIDGIPVLVPGATKTRVLTSQEVNDIVTALHLKSQSDYKILGANGPALREGLVGHLADALQEQAVRENELATLFEGAVSIQVTLKEE